MGENNLKGKLSGRKVRSVCARRVWGGLNSQNVK